MAEVPKAGDRALKPRNDVLVAVYREKSYTEGELRRVLGEHGVPQHRMMRNPCPETPADYIIDLAERDGAAVDAFISDINSMHGYFAKRDPGT